MFPGSTCQCGQPVAPRDNIPIFGWILLRGKARCCGAKLSWRYPATEALTALLFGLLAALLPVWHAVGLMIFTSCLIAGSGIDLDHTMIPDRFTIGLAALGMGASYLLPGLHGYPPGGSHSLDSLKAGVIGLAAGTTGLIWLAFVLGLVLKKDAMGMGDIKLIGAIGMWTGVAGVIAAVFLGAFIGSLAIVGSKIARRPLPERFPFGPMLSAGAIAFILLPDSCLAYAPLLFGRFTPPL